MSGGLEDKAFVVTGAGRGISKAIALGCATAGASVCCAGRTESEIVETVAETARGGGIAIAISGDLTNKDSVQSLFDAAVTAYAGIYRQALMFSPL